MPLIGFPSNMKCLRLLTVCLQGLNVTGCFEGQGVWIERFPVDHRRRADSLAGGPVTSGFTAAAKAATMILNVERIVYVV
jgi:hypothetical protein